MGFQRFPASGSMAGLVKRLGTTYTISNQRLSIQHILPITRPQDLAQVPVEALKLLDNQQVAYRRATDVEVKAAHDQVRNPAPAVL